MLFIVWYLWELSGLISIVTTSGATKYVIQFSEQLTGGIDHSDPRHRPTNEEVAQSAFGSCCTALISDVSASRALGLPLMDAAENSWGTECSAQHGGN